MPTQLLVQSEMAILRKNIRWSAKEKQYHQLCNRTLRVYVDSIVAITAFDYCSDVTTNKRKNPSSRCLQERNPKSHKAEFIKTGNSIRSLYAKSDHTMTFRQEGGERDRSNVLL